MASGGVFVKTSGGVFVMASGGVFFMASGGVFVLASGGVFVITSGEDETRDKPKAQPKTLTWLSLRKIHDAKVVFVVLL
jgi:hypothetical protein